MLLVSVMDNGPGIPLAEQQSIFSRRYRLEQHKNQPGFGLGLTTCKELVDGWAGRIWYEPERVSGSQFCFTVPLWKENMAAEERSGERELFKTRTPRSSFEGEQAESYPSGYMLPMRAR